MPIADTSIEKKRIVLEGELPSVMNPPKGCPFNTRCHRKIGRICETDVPPNIEADPGHMIACHISLEELRQVDPVIKIPKQETAQPSAE